ncbi:type VI secretion system-associated FHA domain protein TagH [Xanthomonas euvesicatoria]|uniref:type VI secretion system-associated FHA domain protein TagH n=1 Tax=Xanthomonas euvesicatoria TaxID=456327 RepID=UPI001C491352|nr:type VI secretion system-associated FHA domain protein TagH [Xanthomonas euvesicatoria]MBV6807935.1 type VI secretion system-associated FHA domain protein TagH [Xanthomonas campestris pv. convolvuli]
MSAASPRLTLTVRDAQAVSGSRPPQASFAAEGGRIGRDASCDWVLEGEGVSRLHASVRYLDGVYFIEDHSTNGVLHNGVPLRAGFPVPLHAGDALRIDAFEIDVAVEGAGVTAVPAATQTWNHAEPWTLSPTPPPQPSQQPPLERERDVFAELGAASTQPADTDPLALFATSFTLAGSQGDAAALGLGHAPATADAYRAPVAVSAAAGVVLPEHWDLTRSEFALPPAIDAIAAVPTPLQPAPVSIVAAAPAPTPAPMPMPASASEVAPASTSAAIPDAAQPVVAQSPDAPELPALFAAMTAGLMDVLRARAELKNSLRLPVTLIQRTENNPLKFAATVDEAVARLLAPAGPGYLTGAAAIDEAMEDIGRHQVALLAGMRAAFEHVFTQFDPARFEADAAGHSALAAWGNRPWRRYAQHYRELLGDPDERFRRLFGEEFARAYEQQLARAKTQAQPADGDRA